MLKFRDEFDEIYQDWLSGGVIVSSSYEVYQILKDIEFKDKKKNPWIELRDQLNWRASDFVKAKALAYWFNGIKIKERKGWRVLAIVNPIQGYNKTFHEVIINPYSYTQKVFCWKVNGDKRRECQGLRTYKVCCHVLAVLYHLTGNCGYYGEYYRMIKSKALEFLEKWRRGDVDGGNPEMDKV